MLWLGRFADVDTLNENSAFRVAAGLDTLTDRRVLVVAASERASGHAASAALDRLYRAHLAPALPVIAPAVERSNVAGAEIVVFDCAPRLDFEELIQLASDRGWRADHGAADGFSVTLRDAIMRVGLRRDPVDGRPHHLGTLALGNVLFAVDGSHVLLGFGHNVVCHDEHGRLNVRQRFFQAPEIAVGHPPSTSSDLVAMIAMTRALMAYVDVHEAIARCLAGNSLVDDLELVRLIIWYETRVMHAPAATRAPIDEYIGVSNRIRALIHTTPDPASFELHVRRLLAQGRPDLLGPRATLDVARDGSWFSVNGLDRVELAASPLLARLLCALVERRLAEPTRGLSVADLQKAGWPGERMVQSSGTNRVYVAVNALRKAGLAAILESPGGGYRLMPSVRLTRHDP